MQINNFMGLTTLEQWLRYILDQSLLREQLSSRLPMIVWVMLAAAAMIWIFVGRTRKGYQFSSVYWLCCGMGIWLSLYRPVDAIVPTVILILSILSFIFGVIPSWVYKYRWLHAWPGRLENLNDAYQVPGGVITSLTAISLLVFFFGLCSLSSLATAMGSAILGMSLLTVFHYDSHRLEAALAGMVMITLAVVSLFLVLTGAGSYSSQTILNLVLIPVAYMSFHWIWLGCVWEQQILNGKPLTTAAKLVPLTKHVGIMMLGFATLLGIKQSLWPIMPVGSFDNTPSRLILIGIFSLVLLGSNFWIWKTLRLFSLGMLLAMNVFSVSMAFLTRFPGFFKQHFEPNWRWVISGYILIVLLIGLMISRRESQKKTSR
jgi:hypothetical protein